MAKYAVTLTDVVRRFGSGDTAIAALHEVSLDVQAGQQVAITGPSGSGKTTLLNLVGALDRPDEGSIWCLGRCLAAMNEREAATFRRRHVGLIFQDNALMDELTVSENVELPLVLIGEDPTARAEKVGQLLDKLGLAEKARVLPGILSAGEKQRVAVARAVVHRPHLLLADEPTANLDSASAETVMNTIESLAADCCLTVLLATHDPRVYNRFNRIVRLEDGRIAGASR